MKRFLITSGLLVAAALTLPPNMAWATDPVAATVLPSELIYLDRFGVKPATLTRPAGQFVLVFHNRLPEREETAQVVLKGATPDANTPTLVTSDGYTITGQVLNLVPGSYVVSFRNHPALSVELTITGH